MIYLEAGLKDLFKMKLYNKAAVLEKYNSRLKFNKFLVPSLMKGQVLVKIILTSICRSQIMEIEGQRNTKKWLPHMLGHEAVGEVIDFHKTCRKFKKGEKVIATWINCKGQKSHGGHINLKYKKINYGPITTFSKYALISENKLVKKPKFLKNNIAPFFGCAALTGMGMIYNEAKPKKSETILLIGLGGIGFFSIIGMFSKGIKNFIVLDTNEKKRKIAKKLGIKYFYNIKNLKEKNDVINNFSEKIDLCLENSGNSRSLEFAISMLKNNGRLYFSSHPGKNKKIKIYPHDLIKGKKIYGSWGGAAAPDRDIPKFAKIILKKSRWTKYIQSRIYHFNKINKAIKDFKLGVVLRPIIKI